MKICKSSVNSLAALPAIVQYAVGGNQWSFSECQLINTSDNLLKLK